MRWLKLIERYSLAKKPTLKATNPRVGTSIIPLDIDDGDIFFHYLTNKIHALHFEGTEKQLAALINHLQISRGFSIQKMKTSVGRGRERLMLLHLKFPDNLEIRRVIKLS